MASAFFPDEVLEMIFDYFPRKLIVDLVKISPTIDRIVFSSTHLKTKIIRGWNHFSFKPDIVLDEDKKPSTSQLWKKVKNFEEISFNLGFMEDSKFHGFLRKYNGSLKRLFANGLTFKQTSNLRKFNMKCLEEIHIERMTKEDVKFMLSVISAPRLRVFHYKDSSAQCSYEKLENDAQAVIDFIAPLIMLKSLSLPCFCTETLLKQPSDCVPFKFQLESLKLLNDYYLRADEEKFAKNFKAFLESQSDSLRQLDLRCFYLNEENINQILGMKHLKMIQSRFCEIDFENFSKVQVLWSAHDKKTFCQIKN